MRLEEQNGDEYEVIDMEAEEKLCNELITKEQAFQVIADNNSSAKMTLACYDALLDGIAKAKAIDAEPIRHWIPVSERLPEFYELVLTWDGYTYSVEKRLPYICDDDGKHIVSDWWVSDDYDESESDYYPNLRDGAAIAWMPLPEPYKEGRDE